MTIFLFLTYFCAAVLIGFPVFALIDWGKKWQLDHKIFWRAGLYAIVIELFFLAVWGNASTLWPDLLDSSILVKALFIAAASGLFFELGRYVILDKVFKKLRSFKECAFFAIGWSGVETLLIGILLIISSVGIQFMVSSNNISSLLPDAGSQELKEVEELKQQSIDLLNGNPLLALTPIVERASRMALDLSLTMLSLLALVKGETKYVWMAVAIRTAVTFCGLLAGSVGAMAGDLVFLTLALFSLFAIKQARTMLPQQLK